MPVKIRLQRRGRKKRPFYHIIIADSRAPRDGRFIESIGTYDPMTRPATINLDQDKAYDWLMKGAQPTETTRAILRFKGVLYKKHLMKGVQKGAMTAEEAEAKWQAWNQDKESRIQKRRDKALADQKAFLEAVSGVIPPVKVKEVEEEPAESEATKAEAAKGEGEAAANEGTEKSDGAADQSNAGGKKAETAPAEETNAVKVKSDDKPEEPVAEASSAEGEQADVQAEGGEAAETVDEPVKNSPAETEDVAKAAGSSEEE